MLEKGSLDARQAKLPEHLYRPKVRDIVPGSAYWIDSNALWVDEDRNIWINDLTPLTYTGDASISSYTRIIAFDEGLVVDISNMRDEYGNLQQFDTASLSTHIDSENFDIGDYQPVIALITTYEELKEVKKIFKKRYGLKLSGRAVKESLSKDSLANEKSKRKVE